MRRWRRVGRGLLVVGVLILGGAGILALSVWRMQRQNTLDRTLIAAILRNDTRTALKVLDEGADANARVHDSVAPPLTLWQQLWNHFHHIHPHSDSDTALLALLDSLAPHKLCACTGGNAEVPDENATIAKALLAHGARVDGRSSIGETPLCLAAGWGYRDTVFLLLAHGAKPDKRSPVQSELMYAAVYSSPTMTEALLNAGADPNFPNSIGDTALNEASRRPMVDANTRARMLVDARFRTKMMVKYRKEMPDAEGVVRLLLAHHADVRPKGWQGLTALGWARKKHNTAIIKMLQAAGVKQ